MAINEVFVELYELLALGWLFTVGPIVIKVS